MAVASVATPAQMDRPYFAGPKPLRTVITDVTMDATNYATGGVPITPAQLGLQQAVYYGVCNVKTVSANGPVQCFLDCTSPGAPKIKCNAAAAEVGAVSLNGAIIEVVAYGL